MFQENVVRVNQSQILFETLASKIYQNPTVSSYREIIANALDIHRQTKQSKKPLLRIEPAPIAVPFNSDAMYVTVRDYGTGISKKDYSNVYLTFFETTKTEADSGAYGLGAKTPFGISYKFINESQQSNTKLSFYVNSYQNGTVTQYINYLSDDGLPVYSTVGEFETDEPDGLEVKFLHLESYNPFKDLMFVISFIDRIDIDIHPELKSINSHYSSAVNGMVRKRVNSNTDIVNIYDIASPLYSEVMGQCGYGRWSNTALMLRKGDIIYKLRNPTTVVEVTEYVNRPVGAIIYVVNASAIPDFEYSIPSSRESIDFAYTEYDKIKEYITLATHKVINKESFIDELLGEFKEKLHGGNTINEAYKIVRTAKSLFRNDGILQYIRKNNITVTDILVRQRSDLVLPEFKSHGKELFTLSYRNKPNTKFSSFGAAINTATYMSNIDDVLFLIRDKKQFSYVHNEVSQRAIVFIDDEPEVLEWLDTHGFVVGRVSDYIKPKVKRKTNIADGDLPRLLDRFGSSIKVTQTVIEKLNDDGHDIIFMQDKKYTFEYNGVTYDVRYFDCNLHLEGDDGSSYTIDMNTKGTFLRTQNSTSQKTIKKANAYIQAGLMMDMSDWLKIKLPKYVVTLSKKASLDYYIKRSNNMVIKVLNSNSGVYRYNLSAAEQSDYEKFKSQYDDFSPSSYLVLRDITEYNSINDKIKLATADEPLIAEIAELLRFKSNNEYQHVMEFFKSKLSEKVDTTLLYDTIESMY